MHIAMTFTRIRTEERMLIDAFEKLDVKLTPIDLRECVFDPQNPEQWAQYDALLDRSLSLTHSLNSTRMFEHIGLRCVNPSSAIQMCSDKLMTTLALVEHGIQTPQVRVGLTAQSGLESIEQLGYPSVIKPTVGSWGRLVARVNDRDAAEAILEHRETLGSVQQKVFYVQEHIEKPERDLRVFVVGDRAIAAIARSSEHWVTNTARGAVASGIPVTDELEDLAIRSARAVGADLAAVDFLECPQNGLLVNEINHSMEFRNSIITTGVDIGEQIAQHIISIAQSCESMRGVGV